MNAATTWDQATPKGVNYKAIDTRFLADMKIEVFCERPYVNDWGQVVYCERRGRHTGRHLALERLARYPVAVWR